LTTTAPSLQPDCARCAGLCCVATAFSASADFAIDKPPGRPCPHLGSDFRCTIHDRLRAAGFPGCAVFDCFGAGQRVTNEVFAGQDWRVNPRAVPAMFHAFHTLRPLHELLWYLAEALALEAAAPLHDALAQARAEAERLAGLPQEALLTVDVNACRGSVNVLLLEASALARAGQPGADHRGADLFGADLKGAGLHGASLRGACLVGADLRETDLRGADLTGADLRGADLRGADLRGALFLHQAQLEAARGDAQTGLPDRRSRPTHW